MLLAIDVGNTQSHLGVFDGDDLAEHWRFATEAEETADELAVRVSTLLALRGMRPEQVDGSVVSSVVPQLTPEYAGMCERYLDGGCLIVGPGVKTGMPIRLDNPLELGADRLVNAVAAYERFGGPCAVADFGTAITFDVVSAEGEYLGGVIGPGVEISMEALARRTAKLPPIELGEPLGEPGGVIGKTTHASLQSGIVYGFAGAVDAIARRVQRELGDQTDFVATGGHAAAIIPFCEMIDEVDDLLTLTGLRLVYERNAMTQPSLTTPFRIGDADGRQPCAAGAPGRDRQLVRAASGAPPRRRARRLGDGLELRASPPQRAHASRAASHPPRGAPGLDPAVRPRSRGDALGRRDRGRGRRRPDRHQHGLPGAQGARGRRRRGAPASGPSSPCGSLGPPREGSGRPVTVKLRSGIDPGDRSGLELALRLVEEAGVAAIALHPRSAAVQHQGQPGLRARPRARRAAGGRPCR